MAYNEHDLLMGMSFLMIASAAITFLLLQFTSLRSFYGRYGTNITSSITLPARWAWLLQELPAFFVPCFLMISGRCARHNHLANMLAIFMYLLHYFQRTFVYPMLIRGGKPTPVSMFLAAWFFCGYNGYLQASYHCNHAVYGPNYLGTFSAVAGISLFFTGFCINVHSDSILRKLRKRGETGYRIPKGGLFRYVSGANFFGEIMEWVGYALYCKTWPAAAFALFTVANIGPRAFHHHKFYLEKFPDYPKKRKALIPFLF